jgi:hypothetical protein
MEFATGLMIGLLIAAVSACLSAHINWKFAKKRFKGTPATVEDLYEKGYKDGHVFILNGKDLLFSPRPRRESMIPQFVYQLYDKQTCQTIFVACDQSLVAREIILRNHGFVEITN